VILVVDDDASVRRFVRAALENAGYQVGEAAASEEALRLFESNYYDLLIADIVMPGVNGLQLAAGAHHLSPGLRVIFMSGFTAQYEEELSGSVCLSKPFTVAALLGAVESAIGLPRKKAG
jgi:two-component system, cell cycle response regulator CpdR